jgi:hypothetical protein
VALRVASAGVSLLAHSLLRRNGSYWDWLELVFQRAGAQLRKLPTQLEQPKLSLGVSPCEPSGRRSVTALRKHALVRRWDSADTTYMA